MIEHAKGACEGVYTAENGDAKTDSNACNTKCLADSSCLYTSFASGHACWLFKGEKCKIDTEMKVLSTTYKKSKQKVLCAL